MSWVSRPMIVRLDAIWPSVRKGFCSSAIAASIRTRSAPTSSRRARRWVNVAMSFDGHVLLPLEVALPRRIPAEVARERRADALDRHRAVDGAEVLVERLFLVLQEVFRGVF